MCVSKTLSKFPVNGYKSTSSSKKKKKVSSVGTGRVRKERNSLDGAEKRWEEQRLLGSAIPSGPHSEVSQ